MTFTNVLNGEGSPGRVFLLNERDLDERIIRLEDFTNGELRWDGSAGLRQIIASKKIEELGNEKKMYLKMVYN